MGLRRFLFPSPPPTAGTCFALSSPALCQPEKGPRPPVQVGSRGLRVSWQVRVQATGQWEEEGAGIT